jgi:hypothetical protein
VFIFCVSLTVRLTDCSSSERERLNFSSGWVGLGLNFNPTNQQLIQQGLPQAGARLKKLKTDKTPALRQETEGQALRAVRPLDISFWAI